MERPNKFNPALGVLGNIENALWENQYTNNQVFNNKSSYDQDHIAMEQALTENYLDNVQAQQDLTDLMLTIAEEK